MSYNPNIPQPTDLLSDSQQDLLNNFTAANTSFGINHYAFDNGTVDNGKHKFVSLTTQGTTIAGSPATAATDVAVYNRSQVGLDSGKQNLYYKFQNQGAGIGTDVILTRFLSPVSATNGYTFIPGGFFVQWGVVTTAATSGTVTFSTANVQFPSNCFNVSITPKYTGAAPNGNATYAFDSSTLSNVKFDWTLNTNSGAYTGFYWIAIGN
jgi:hypothetical protein